MRLVLVRHGETEWTEQGRLHGRLDSPLSARGRLHAEQTAARLQGERFDALYTSPQGRARQTAAILAPAVGLAPTPLDDLREADFGWLEGKPLRLVDPDGPAVRLLRPAMWLARAVSAEPPEKVARRVKAAVETMRRQYPDGRLLVVTHWGILSMVLALLVDGGHENWRGRGPWTACGLSELYAANGAWHVVYLDEKAHLQ